MGDDLPNTRRKRAENSSCECCHRRKVRCDVNSNGPPCTNCHLDGRQCVLRVPLKRYEYPCLVGGEICSDAVCRRAFNSDSDTKYCRGRKSKLQRKEALLTSSLGTSEKTSEPTSVQTQDGTIDESSVVASSTQEVPSLPEISECCEYRWSFFRELGCSHI
jgi:hypothetical protein